MHILTIVAFYNNFNNYMVKHYEENNHDIIASDRGNSCIDG
jgi:hypothetical protein